MASSMEFIARSVADGSTHTTTFTSIPQTFTDILVVGSVYSDHATDGSWDLAVRPNSQSASTYYFSQLGVLYSNNSSSARNTYTWGDSAFKMSTIIPSEGSNLKFPSSYFNLYIANYTDSYGTGNYMNIFGNGGGFSGPRSSPVDTASRQGGLMICECKVGATAAMPMTSLYFEISYGNMEAGSVITLYGIDAS